MKRIFEKNTIRDLIRTYSVMLKYMFSSLLSVLIDYGVFFFLNRYTANVFLLTYAGRFCSAMVNFTINRNVVFMEREQIILQLVKYLTLLWFSGTVSALMVSVIINIIDIEIIYARFLIEFMLFFLIFMCKKNLFLRRGRERT